VTILINRRALTIAVGAWIRANTVTDDKRHQLVDMTGGITQNRRYCNGGGVDERSLPFKNTKRRFSTVFRFSELFNLRTFATKNEPEHATPSNFTRVRACSRYFLAYAQCVRTRNVKLRVRLRNVRSLIERFAGRVVSSTGGYDDNYVNRTATIVKNPSKIMSGAKRPPN